VLEDPLPRDNIGPRRTRQEILGVVLQESTVFFLHSGSPIGVSKSAMDGLWHWRERHGVVDGGHLVAALGTGAHRVLVCHWRNNNCTLGQRYCWCSRGG